MRKLTLLLLVPSSLLGQFHRSISVTPGFKVGSPITGPGINGVYSSASEGRWTGGPSIELNLPYRFAIEFDALYRTRTDGSNYPFRLAPNVNPFFSSSFTKSHVWDFPLLLKYRFAVGGLRPFVSAGYQWSRTSSTSSSLLQCSGPEGSCRPPDFPGGDFMGGYFRSTNVRGRAVGGIGIEFKGRLVNIVPEVRFNQGITGMVGFTFGRRGRK